MRKFNALVFDEYVPNTTTVYTSAALNERLGAFDKLGIMAVGDNSGVGATLTVQIEHSADQRNWVVKNVNTPEISALAIVNTTQQGSDTTTIPSFGFVRLRITLGGTNPNSHLKIYVTARDTAQ